LCAIWLPFVDTFEAGLWLYWCTADGIVAVERPSLRMDDGRLHCATGPAVERPSGEAYYFLRGVQVPREWVESPRELSATAALTWANMEQRRIACADVVGWPRILSELKAGTIDTDPEPEIGTLVEVNLPDAGKTRFLRVRCGTGRDFAICVPPETRTALEGQAWCMGLAPKDFIAPEVRT
jgi:hypothetical protein